MMNMFVRVPATPQIPSGGIRRASGASAAADEEGGLDTRALPRQERRALNLLCEGAAECNGQFEEEAEMLDLTQFKQLVLGLWPPGAAADEDGSERGGRGERGGRREGEEGDRTARRATLRMTTRTTGECKG